MESRPVNARKGGISAEKKKASKLGCRAKKKMLWGKAMKMNLEI